MISSIATRGKVKLSEIVGANSLGFDLQQTADISDPGGLVRTLSRAYNCPRTFTRRVQARVPQRRLGLFKFQIPMELTFGDNGSAKDDAFEVAIMDELREEVDFVLHTPPGDTRSDVMQIVYQSNAGVANLRIRALYCPDDQCTFFAKVDAFFGLSFNTNGRDRISERFAPGEELQVQVQAQ